MMSDVLFYLHYALILIFGIVLSSAFCDVAFTKKNFLRLFLLFLVCGALQLLVFTALGEDIVWKLYPLIVHVPLLMVLCLGYKKRFVSAIAAIATAYMCCQIPKWVGLLVGLLAGNDVANQITSIAVIILAGYLIVKYVSEYIALIYDKTLRDIVIFAIVPVVYYLFDYGTSIYTNFLMGNNRTATEFLPFFLCLVFMIFCVIYYREVEDKLAAEQKEHFIVMKAAQQEKELSAIKESEDAVRILRHDMRLLLNTLSTCIENDDSEGAKKLIAGYISQIDHTLVHRYCQNDTLNYVLSNYAERFKKENISFHVEIGITDFTYDEIMFSSILSNALDNAYHAQLLLPVNKRQVTLKLKTANDRLLMSVLNPYHKAPVFVDNIPISTQKGHGYGTKSIRYLTEQLGGHCQFSAQDGMFVLKVVL